MLLLFRSDETKDMGTIEGVRHIQGQKKLPNENGRQTADQAVKDKVNREILGALAKQKQGNTMAYSGNKPAEMMRCLQDMEQHYRAALEEKVWEMFEMREANEALAKSVSDTQIARAKEIAIAKAREEEWNRHEARMHEAEETALRLQTRVRGLLKYEELYQSGRVENGTMTEKLNEARQGRLTAEDELGDLFLSHISHISLSFLLSLLLTFLSHFAHISLIFAPQVRRSSPWSRRGMAGRSSVRIYATPLRRPSRE